MDEANGMDRRRFPRANFPCRLMLNVSGQPLVTHTENISEGGVRVVADRRVEAYKEADLEIFIGNSRLIAGKGKIAWVRERQNPLEGQAFMFDVGIVFTQISDEDRQYLRNLVETLLSTDESENASE